MAKKHSYILIFLLIIFSGCPLKKKSTERKLIGTWEWVNVIDPTSNEKILWTFDKDGSLSWVSIKNNMPPQGAEDGTYLVEIKLSGRYLYLYGLTATLGLNGKWQITKLSKKKMILVFDEPTGVLIIEFYRVD